MKQKLIIYSQTNYLLLRTAIEAVHAVRQSRTSMQILFAVCIIEKQALTGGKSLACEDKYSKKIGAISVQQADRCSFEARAVLHQKPYLLVQFLIISFAYAKLIRLKSPPSVSERNCKNKIEQSAAESCLRTFELRVFDKTSRIKPLNLLNALTDRTFENRHVGCKEREKINRRRTLCTLRINFFEATPQTACIFSKEMTHTDNHGDNDEQKEKRYYYHSDHLGSAQFVTDWKGRQYEHIEYTPYGELWVEETAAGIDKLPFRFTGKELDEETGLYYYGARYLDPKYSRWLSGDPALNDYMAGSSNGMSGGIFNTTNFNLYHYAGNNPIRYTDPTGLELEDGANVSKQLEYLKGIVNTNYKTKQDKADAAKALRNEMRNEHPERFNLDDLFLGKEGNEKFMNEDLRDFLNTSDTGEDYTLKDMKASDGWVERTGSARSEHQYGVGKGQLENRKFVNERDGREAVFQGDGRLKGSLITRGINKGTYNYAKDTSSWHSGWTAGGDHGRWDMNPFFRQWGITPIYRLIFGHSYSQDQYNKNGR
ncbi:RHS repeat domain-containing protein [Treponema pedis]|uniref:Teneurin-like YD-shell domain-containing protein n=1 Tax=Treponema pedis str. T A4 TaxID=1291379 RepID=S5ZNM4_9SPIR|nr:RHS repeat-associated core domain-containing protein [Treponema pedis]AGT44187.1 hypothetical protein TPE_1711 [Treponema pedis str. T A4]